MVKIGLDAGHYAGDGRVDKDFRAALGTKDEYTLNLRVYKVVERILESSGHTVIDIGRQEQSVTVRAKRAAQNECDLVVSIHHNAGRGRGATLFRHKNGTMGSASRRLQESIYAHVEKINRGNRSTPINKEEFGVINCDVTKCPSVLVECAFMDNCTDIGLINSAGYAERMGAAIAAGINDYTGAAGNTGSGETDDKHAPVPAVVKTYNPAAYAKVRGLTKADSHLNVRSGPGTGHGILRQLANGNEVDVLTLYSNNWAKVNIVGQQGYVHADYLDIQERKPAKRIVTVTGCTALNVRTIPNGPVVAGIVKAGTVLDQVRHGGLAGFIWPKYVE